MENPLPLKLIEEQELFEKLLELLVLSTHSPKGRFSKDNSYIIFKKKLGNNKRWEHCKIGIAFPSFFVDTCQPT